MRFPTKRASDYEVEELDYIIQKNIKDCYQCLKCSSGCPLTSHMDYYPHQVMWLAKMGLFDQIVDSKTLWICASCLTCSSRCPRDLEPAKVMEGFRAMVLRSRQQEGASLGQAKDLPRQALISSMRKFRR